ncbi:hypothetical protein MFLAVUS_010224 [Mucor flavus]|uniref:Uncharacterized protein n=1 Tax=Mucor flavus TaxID=439312 RepID=A0ABP9ZC59_9FUNG
MKISYSIMLLVAVAASQINAAATPNAASKCISGSSGKGQGNGYKNYCCKDQSDCLDDCVKGVCVGPVKPTGTTTATPTSVPTPGACTAGSHGLGKGDGYKDACCKNQADCIDDCVKGACVGPVNTKTTTVTKTASGTASTTVPTAVPTPGTCTAGSHGLGKGDGYKDACCKNQADCIDDCVKGACVGPVNTKTTTVTKTASGTASTTVPTAVPTPGACTPGSHGLGKGDGYKDACCKNQADCIDDCVKGACVGPVNTKTTTVTKTASGTASTTVPTAVPTPGACTPGSHGLGKGDGYKDACCKNQADCIDDCVKGACVGPVNTKTTTVTKTASGTASTTAPTSVPTPGACTAGSHGLGKGDGYKGACCKNQADCIDDCVKGACVGPVNTKTATKTSSAIPSTPTPEACVAGFFGKGNGRGGDDACCKDQSDCKESCLSGKCGVA